MKTYRYAYSDVSMIAYHLRPYEVEVRADDDERADAEALALVAKLHGVTVEKLRADWQGDIADVLDAETGEQVGDLWFVEVD